MKKTCQFRGCLYRGKISASTGINMNGLVVTAFLVIQGEMRLFEIWHFFDIWYREC